MTPHAGWSCAIIETDVLWPDHEAMTNEVPMKTISCTLSEALNAQLTILIRQRRTSKAAVVRAALEAYLTREETTAGASILDLV